MSVLYKVAPPRAGMTFSPCRFWRTADWESSTSQPRAGYIEDTVLYAGDFDEVNIHLFPRGRTIRVRSADASLSLMQSLGIRCCAGMTAYIFVHQSVKAEVQSFQPTIFTFERDGFTRVRKGEYVSRQPQTAISSETISMCEAIVRCNIELQYVEDLDAIARVLSAAGIYFDEQT